MVEMRLCLLLGCLLLTSNVRAWVVGPSPMALRRPSRGGILCVRAAADKSGRATSQDSNMLQYRRRDVVLASGSILAGFVASPAFAAIPSMEEYNVGTGTVVKGSGGAEKKQFAPPTDKPSAISAVKEASALLATFPGLIDKQAWDDIRADMQSVPLSQKYAKPDRPGVIMLPFLGLKSKDSLKESLGFDDKKAAAVEKARKDSSQALQELSEFAFTNRIPFFNAEDKKSVAQLAEKNVNVDLDEAKDMVDRAQGSIADLLTLLLQ